MSDPKYCAHCGEPLYTIGVGGSETIEVERKGEFESLIKKIDIMIKHISNVNNNAKSIADLALMQHSNKRLASIGTKSLIPKVSRELIREWLVGEGLYSSDSDVETILIFLVQKDLDLLEFLELDFQQKHYRQYLQLILNHQQQEQSD